MITAIKKYFGTFPETIEVKNYRFYSINNAAGHFGLGVHALWIILFGIMGVYEMCYFNILSVAVFVVMIRSNNRGHHLFSALLGTTEVCIHQILAVYFISWESGFQYYIMVVCVLPFMQARGNTSLKFIWSMLTLVSFLIIELFLHRTAPIYNIDALLLEVLNISNITFSFIFLAVWGALFNYFAFRTEDDLERQTIDLEQRTIDLVQQTKLATLGRTAAGLAHEVNTPLGAIKASASESLEISARNFANIITAIRKFNNESIERIKSFLKEFDIPKEFITTKEERAKRKVLQAQLLDLKLAEPEFTAQQFVKVGVYEISDDLKFLLNNENEGLILAFIVNTLSHHRNLENVIHATDKAARLVGSFKMYAAPQNSENASTDLNQSIETVLIIYQNMLKKGITVNKEYEVECFVPIDQDKLNQVWTNLIHNAIQAMKDYGEINIQITEENGEVLVALSDTGCGIPQEISEKVFEPFFTTKEAGVGTGLGLDIVKKIIEEGGGTISFDSVIDKGTTFFVKIPIINKEAVKV